MAMFGRYSTLEPAIHWARAADDSGGSTNFSPLPRPDLTKLAATLSECLSSPSAELRYEAAAALVELDAEHATLPSVLAAARWRHTPACRRRCGRLLPDAERTSRSNPIARRESIRRPRLSTR